MNRPPVTLLAISILAGAQPAMTQSVRPATKPTFVAYRHDTWAFARATEAYCGFRPGAELAVPDSKTILVRNHDLKRVTFPRFQCLMETLNWEDLQKSGVRMVVIGEEMP